MLSKAWNKYKRFPVQVRASFWFLICSFLQKGISVITTPIFTRLLSTAEYGQYSVFDSWLKIVTIFVSLHLYSGVYIQGLVKFSDDRKRYSSSLQGLTLLLCVGWTVVYLLFHEYWNRLFTLTTVQMLAMLVMI
jgi:O-antigen/teichoic acid export membrane protein